MSAATRDEKIGHTNADNREINESKHSRDIICDQTECTCDNVIAINIILNTDSFLVLLFRRTFARDNFVTQL